MVQRFDVLIRSPSERTQYEPGYTGTVHRDNLSTSRARRPDVEIIMKLKFALVIAAVLSAVNVSAQDRRYDAPPG